MHALLGTALCMVLASCIFVSLLTVPWRFKSPLWLLLTSTGKHIPTFRRNRLISPSVSSNVWRVDCSTIKAKASRSSETSVSVYQSIWHKIRDNVTVYRDYSENVLMANEMHNSYNKFYSTVFSAVHVSNESIRSSSGARHNILYYTVRYNRYNRAG